MSFYLFARDEHDRVVQKPEREARHGRDQAQFHELRPRRRLRRAARRHGEQGWRPPPPPRAQFGFRDDAVVVQVRLLERLLRSIHAQVCGRDVEGVGEAQPAGERQRGGGPGGAAPPAAPAPAFAPPASPRASPVSWGTDTGG